MSVKSSTLHDGKTEDARRRAYRSPTAVVEPDSAVRVMVIVLRVAAVLLLVFSTFGNYVTFAGGWDALGWNWRDLGASFAAINWPMVVAAIVFQIIFAALQWGAKAAAADEPLWWWAYAFALIASAVPSFLTYNSWAGPFLAFHIGGLFAGVLIFIASAGGDALPEWVLVG